MVSLRQIEAAINQNELVSLTQELVRAKTVNPPGDENLILPVLEKRLEELGIDYKIFEKGKGRPNIVAHLKGGKGPKLMLQGHTDVVPAEGKWKFDPFGGKIVGNKIYGRGSNDMKGGVASIFHMLEVLYKLEFEPQGEIFVAACCNEETGDTEKIGMHHVIEKIRPDEVIIAEPTGLQIIAAEKGPYWLEVETFGKAAHGSAPELGINAIEKMAQVIMRLKKFRMKYRKHPLLSPPTVNIGTISGGSKINIVPASCKLTLDIRTLPGQTREEIRSQLKKILGEAKITRELQYNPPLEVSLNQPFIFELKKSIQSVLGKPARTRGVSGFTDARITIRDYGIPAVVCGPGDLELAHTENEYMQIDQLVKACKIFSLFAVNRLSE